MPRPPYPERLITKTIKIPTTVADEIDEKGINFSGWVRDAWNTYETDNLDRQLLELDSQIRSLQSRREIIAATMKKREEKFKERETAQKIRSEETSRLEVLRAELLQLKRKDRELCNEAYDELKIQRQDIQNLPELQKLELQLGAIRKKLNGDAK